MKGKENKEEDEEKEEKNIDDMHETPSPSDILGRCFRFFGLLDDRWRGNKGADILRRQMFRYRRWLLLLL